MAYRLLYNGAHKHKIRKGTEKLPALACKINDEDVVVLWDEVKGYVECPIFGYILGVYNYTEIWGLPNGNSNGWTNEPVEILEGITALKLESKAIEYDEISKARDKSS